MSDPRLVYIEWEDASSVDLTTGWVYREGAPPPDVRVFKQVGFLLELTPEAIVLTAALDEHQMGPRTRIPAGMLRHLVELDIALGAPLKIPKKRRRKT